MHEKQPNPARLIDRLDLEFPLVGLYDAPDPAPFAPIVKPGKGACLFAFFDAWRRGETLHLTEDHFGCPGCGRWMFDVMARSRDDFIRFLLDGEGLKASRELMERWIDHSRPYRRENDHILIGPLKPAQWPFLKTVTLFVNPDQLSNLVYGTQYFSAPEDPPPMTAPFGSGCMQMIPFEDLSLSQAALGATDLAMRRHLPPDILSVSVTREMFRRLCDLDDKSFLGKHFLKTLRRSRGGKL